LVVTENGYGKRTDVSEYPVKNRGTKGVLTIKLTEAKGGLAGALIVREHQELMFITENGMVQRTGAGGISKTGRATQGVKVMNVKDGDRISAVALVVEAATENGSGEDAAPEGEAPEQPELEAAVEATDATEAADSADTDATDAESSETEATEE
jgi:DNA gyrase subunit A